MIITELIDFVFNLLYLLLKYLCMLIDFIEKVFFKLSGIEKINVDGKSLDLLTYFIETDSINKSFYMVLLIGVIMLFVFTIIAIIKEAGSEKKVSKSEVLFRSLKGFILIVITPFIFLAIVTLSTAILVSLFNATNTTFIDNNLLSKISQEIFLTSSKDAYIGDENIYELISYKFQVGELSFYSEEDVRNYYDLTKINFLVGILSATIILVLFSLCIIQLIQRIFDVIMLYLISPVALAAMPLNDEHYFNQYKNQLISKLLSTYGIIISLNLFYLIVPMINEITFFDSSFEDGLMHIIFIIGGAFAVTKSNQTINRIIDYDGDRRTYRDALTPIRSSMHFTRNFILDTTRLAKDINYKKDKKNG